MGNKVKYIKSVYTTYLMEWMARRAGKLKKNWLDKKINAVLEKAVRTDHLENDYMKDEWLESEPGFTIEELEAYENAKQ